MTEMIFVYNNPKLTIGFFCNLEFTLTLTEGAGSLQVHHFAPLYTIKSDTLDL